MKRHSTYHFKLSKSDEIVNLKHFSVKMGRNDFKLFGGGGGEENTIRPGSACLQAL